MLPYILIGFAVLVVLLIVVVAKQPPEFRVERSATINAPAAAVFDQVNDLHKFQDWSPWAKVDPNCKVVFSGPASGTGTSFSWSGNNKVGQGSMTATESRPNELVRFRLEFLKPFKVTNTAEFTFKSAGNQTTITWAMMGRNNFMSKAFGLIVNCDKMIGSHFEKGLKDLKTLSEAAAGK